MTNLVLDKVAWVRLDELGRILVTRNHGRDVFYFPGGRREAGETDVDTLVREIAEELGAAVLAATTRHFGTYEVTADVGAMVRMTCYSADYRGILQPDNEIAEMAWMTYADRNLVSPRCRTPRRSPHRTCRRRLTVRLREFRFATGEVADRQRRLPGMPRGSGGTGVHIAVDVGESTT